MINTPDLTSVKQIAAILVRQPSDFEDSMVALGEIFSEVDFIGEFFPFSLTDYYAPEMGEELRRGFVSFKKLIHPESLARSKRQARELERKLSLNGNRTVNIDVGYLDMFKIVLASFKGRSNKIYLEGGIWADMVMYYENGDFKTFSWGFPDFKSGIYNADLVDIRELYKEQFKAERRELRRQKS